MAKVIDYYFTPGSPWTYLGHERFVALARKHGCEIRLKPMDLGTIFPVSGGLPLAKRAPQRQSYRLAELARWREFLGLPLNLKPKFAGAPGVDAVKLILAADEQGTDRAIRLAGAFMRAIWAEERDIGDAVTRAAIITEQGLDAESLAARAAAPEIAARYEACTQEALERQVFGAPTYVYRDELFWGQDRLDFLDRALAK
jgi:2-hydroxychromene-2-carboxylate isomerase